MSKVDLDGEISERARLLLAEHFSARGRFPLLEKLSGISSAQWQNFYYKKQRINDGMLHFLLKHLPHDEIWLLTGEKPPEQAQYPFLAPVPRASDCQTIGQRLNWVIREWASPKGEALFKYLAAKSNQKISADDWAKVVLGLASPTLDMVDVVCSERPHFTEWVLRGGVGVQQVDPTSQTSVAAWKAHREAAWNVFAVELEKSSNKDVPRQSKPKVIKPTKKHGNKKG